MTHLYAELRGKTIKLYDGAGPTYLGSIDLSEIIDPLEKRIKDLETRLGNVSFMTFGPRPRDSQLDDVPFRLPDGVALPTVGPSIVPTAGEEG